MADVMLRFDMRQPDIAKASQADLYQAAIEICEWETITTSAACTYQSTMAPQTATARLH